MARIEDWQYLDSRKLAIRQLLAQLGGVTANGLQDAEARGGLLGNAADQNSFPYRRARWNYSLVLNDGSFGVHHFDYAPLRDRVPSAPAGCEGIDIDPGASGV